VGKKCSNEEFVRAYLAHSTTAGVSKALGISATTVSTKAASLRRQGVNLIKKSAKEAVDVAGLNKLIASLSNGATKELAPSEVAGRTLESRPVGQRDLSKSTTERTKQIIEFIDRKGPQVPEAIGKACGLSYSTVELLVKQKYFSKENNRVSLTTFAHAEFLGKTE
jgi:hypothetical protein